jgi:hypothetical protein
VNSPQLAAEKFPKLALGLIPLIGIMMGTFKVIKLKIQLVGGIPWISG